MQSPMTVKQLSRANVPGNQTQPFLAGSFPAVTCGRSQRLCPQVSSQNGCFCNVSPDEMTHWGRVNFYLPLFWAVIRPERSGGAAHESNLQSLPGPEVLVIIVGIWWPRYARELGRSAAKDVSAWAIRDAVASFLSVCSDQRPAKSIPKLLVLTQLWLLLCREIFKDGTTSRSQWSFFTIAKVCIKCLIFIENTCSAWRDFKVLKAGKTCKLLIF